MPIPHPAVSGCITSITPCTFIRDAKVYARVEIMLKIVAPPTRAPSSVSPYAAIAVIRDAPDDLTTCAFDHTTGRFDVIPPAAYDDAGIASDGTWQGWQVGSSAFGGCTTVCAERYFILPTKRDGPADVQRELCRKGSAWRLLLGAKVQVGVGSADVLYTWTNALILPDDLLDTSPVQVDGRWGRAGQSPRWRVIPCCAGDDDDEAEGAAG